jgi:hypothetical protein
MLTQSKGVASQAKKKNGVQPKANKCFSIVGIEKVHK